MCLRRRKKGLTEHSRIVVDNVKAHTISDYTRLKDNILYMNADGKAQVIQMESSLAHECKTTVACNLAVLLGQTEKKVIVIDLDFRRPRVHRLFGLSKEEGLSDFMLDNADKKKYVKHTAYQNVDVLTRGGSVHNSALILCSDKFKKLIEELRAEYDYVILDCAPVLLVSDYIHISKVSDGVLFLVAYGITTKTQVVDAISDLRKNDVKILGSVFTMYDRKKDKNYGMYYYKNRYYKYYDTYAKSYFDDESVESGKEEINKD